jgi:hypothetical protein
MSNVGATQLASLIRSLSRNPWLSRNVTKTLDELESLAGRTLDIGHWTLDCFGGHWTLDFLFIHRLVRKRRGATGVVASA